MNAVYRHKKTGHLYVKAQMATDCTNATANRKMVIYYALNNATTFFTRELSEFNEKFELVR